MRADFHSLLLLVWMASAVATSAETFYHVVLRRKKVEEEGLSLMLARVAAAPGVFMLGEQTAHFLWHELTDQRQPELHTCMSTWIALAFIVIGPFLFIGAMRLLIQRPPIWHVVVRIVCSIIVWGVSSYLALLFMLLV